MNKYIQIVKLCKLSLALILASATMATATNAATAKNSPSLQIKRIVNSEFLQIAAVDLSKILPYIMKNNDIIHEHTIVIYNNVEALRLRIFNQKTGKVRYVYIDNTTGEILD
ncbi:MAG: hypothetical protein HRU29_03175 [Rhizobiales bacterium]|nr:hypothetical protein [Hyphomicrobiales bacterium]NRB13380.1 hypothetical protein [Hyphomicrobiales bacterium]